MFLKFQISIFFLLSCFLVQANVITPEQQRELDRKLITAVRKRDVSEVRVLLMEGADPNCTTEDGEKPLHLLTPVRRSVYRNNEAEDFGDKNFAITKFLLEAGADAKATTPNGETPLHRALKIQINDFVDIDIRGRVYNDFYNFSTSRVILYNGIVKNVKLLLEGGADPNFTDDKGNTPLAFISLNGNPFPREGMSIATALVEGGGNPAIRNINGDLPLLVKTNPSLLELYAQLEEKKEEATSCEYVGEGPSQIQIARYSICLAEVSCKFKVGAYSYKTYVKRNFQAVCSRLADGQCPPANDCVLDRSVMEVAEKQTEKTRPSLTVPVEPYSSGFR